MLTPNNKPDIHENVAEHLEYCMSVLEQLESSTMNLEVTVMCNAVKGLVLAMTDLLDMSISAIQNTHNNTETLHRLTRKQRL